MEKNLQFLPFQKKILALCIAAYTCAYLLRVNMSIALPGIASDLSFNNAQLGFIASGFFWTYALGQLLSGLLGDHLPAKVMVGAGLAISAVSNLLMSVSSSNAFMVLVWGLNGLSQSMLWAPMVRFISLNFEGKKLVRASFAMSFTLILGYLISWTCSALIKEFFGWRMIFVIPSFLVFGFLIVWLVFFPKEKRFLKNAVSYKLPIFKDSYFTILLLLITLSALSHGMVKESINIWLPTMLEAVSGFSLGSSLGVLIVVPIINFAGILISKYITKKTGSDIYKTILILFVVSFVISGISIFVNVFPPIVTVIITILLFGLMFSVNPLFTSFIPLEFVRFNIVSSIAGVVDCSIYIGAALSGIITGLILKNDDWSKVSLMWFITVFVGLVILILINILVKKGKYNNGKVI